MAPISENEILQHRKPRTAISSPVPPSGDPPPRSGSLPVLSSGLATSQARRHPAARCSSRWQGPRSKLCSGVVFGGVGVGVKTSSKASSAASRAVSSACRAVSTAIWNQAFSPTTPDLLVIIQAITQVPHAVSPPVRQRLFLPRLARRGARTVPASAAAQPNAETTTHTKPCAAWVGEGAKLRHKRHPGSTDITVDRFSLKFVLFGRGQGESCCSSFPAFALVIHFA